MVLEALSISVGERDGEVGGDGADESGCGVGGGDIDGVFGVDMFVVGRGESGHGVHGD